MRSKSSRVKTTILIANLAWMKKSDTLISLFRHSKEDWIQSRLTRKR